jgi:hypothetical protein
MWLPGSGASLTGREEATDVFSRSTIKQTDVGYTVYFFAAQFYWAAFLLGQDDRPPCFAQISIFSCTRWYRQSLRPRFTAKNSCESG